MLSAINVLRRHRWICGQKDVQAVLQDTNPQNSGSLGKRREEAAGKGANEGALRCSLKTPGAGGASWDGWATLWRLSTSLCFQLSAPAASADGSQPLVPLSGWDNPHLLRGTVWPPFNLGANPPFKPFPVKAGVRSLRFTVLFWALSSSASNFGTWSCLYCWGRAISSETGLDHLLL